MPVRVLIVDDSAIVRRLLSDGLSCDPAIEVVGTAADPFAARDKILRFQPDVLTLDIEMPRMDGITFLRRLMRYRPMPVVVLSSLVGKGAELALEATDAGAVDVLLKPSVSAPEASDLRRLAQTIKAAARARLRPGTLPVVARTASAASPAGKLLAVGASTGGTQALQYLLASMPANGPATVIAQHMPPRFTETFAARLDATSPMRVKEAEDGDEIVPGRALVAPGGRHLLVRKTADGLRAELKDGPLVSRHRPSVDVLFRSVARAAGPEAVGAILTGMGDDGADGLLVMRQAGARTVAQDEASCIVFGMPKEAIERGAAEHVLPLESMPHRLLGLAR